MSFWRWLVRLLRGQRTSNPKFALTYVKRRGWSPQNVVAAGLTKPFCGVRMSKLNGREVLIVEDHPLILMDVAHALRQLGAIPTTATTLKQALIVVEHENLAAAILDHALPDGDSSILCEKLDVRKVPFVIYSGYNRINGACAKGALVEKPASTDKLIATVENLLPA